MGLARLSSSQPAASSPARPTDAEERCADEAETRVADEHVLGYVHIACEGVPVCDTEEQVEHDRKADRGE
jgi:hypothetical protein